MKLIALFSLVISCFMLTAYVGKVEVKSLISKTAKDLVITDSTEIGTKTIISKLNVPWQITWGPDNWIWFTEQSGSVSKVNPATGETKVLLRIPEVYRFRSLGLLGMAIHPDKKMPYIYLDYTYKNGASILAKLVRYTYTADTLLNPVILLKDIPGATGHNGSRIVIAPDGKIMMSTGYAAITKNSQDIGSLNGKILRLNIDGTIPTDNPFPGSPVWSFGHRNPQGLAYDKNGTLFSSEHGDAIEDELNIIKKGGNYGWPNVEGFCNTPAEIEFCKIHHVIEPIKSWTPVIAPSGIAYYNSASVPGWKNSILLVTLKTQSLRVLKINSAGDGITSEKIYLDHEFGRLRSVCVSPAGEVYVSTSNRDWNPGEGFPKEEDDKIIKIVEVAVGNKKPGKNLATVKQASSYTAMEKHRSPVLPAGAVIYNNYCASCHKSTGNGVAGVYPPLNRTSQVFGNKNALVQLILNAPKGSLTIKGVKYNPEMPAFNFLSDKDIAQVATYIRTHFGNRASSVNTMEVLTVRKAKLKL